MRYNIVNDDGVILDGPYDTEKDACHVAAKYLNLYQCSVEPE